MKSNPPVLLLAGATAVGKTAIALEIAERIGGEIVSADARQIYRYLDIGTAKPTASEQRRIRHHLIDICEPDDRYSAARFRDDAHAAIRGIHTRGKHALVVGGTGLYFKAIAEGLFEAPDTGPEVRAEVDRLVEHRGLEGLRSYLADSDPATLAEIDPGNPARLRRAVEFHLQTGMSLVEARRATTPNPLPYRWMMIQLTRPREELRTRIEARVDEMLAKGWQDEVRQLRTKFDFRLPAFNAVGYRELEAVENNKVTPETGRKRIVERTRQYAKRQLTWFRNQGGWRPLAVKDGLSAKIALGLEKNADDKSA